MADFNVTVKPDEILFEDLVMFEDWQNGKVSMREVLGFLKRVVVCDTPIEKIPVPRIRELMAAITEAVGEMQNPKN
jgi:predicted RNA-binding protein